MDGDFFMVPNPMNTWMIWGVKTTDHPPIFGSTPKLLRVFRSPPPNRLVSKPPAGSPCSHKDGSQKYLGSFQRGFQGGGSTFFWNHRKMNVAGIWKSQKKTLEKENHLETIHQKNSGVFQNVFFFRVKVLWKSVSLEKDLKWGASPMDTAKNSGWWVFHPPGNEKTHHL